MRLALAFAAAVTLAFGQYFPPGGGGAGGGGSILNGTSDPSNSVGANGSFYLNTTTSCLWGPKASGAWPPTCVSLVGPAGSAGPQGPSGAPGTPGYSPNALISGGGVSLTSGYTFQVSAAVYTIAGQKYSSPETTVTLSAADPTNDRIDVIYVDNTGAVGRLTGTPSATPTPPSVDGATQLSLSFVYVTAASSTPVAATTTLLYAENVGSPTEWNCTNSGAPINCNSTNNPHSGSKDIEATAATTNNYAQLAKGSGTVDLSTLNNLVFYVRSKASWAASRSLQIRFLNAGTAVGSTVTLTNTMFGFNSAQTTAYQQMVVPLSLFTTGSAAINQIRFTVGGSGATIGFYIDDVSLQGGVVQGAAPSGLTWCGAWNSTATYAVNCFVTYQSYLWIALAANTNSAPTTSNTTNWVRGGAPVTVVSAGNLTSTAVMTGGGTQTAQTPSATSTLDSSGNFSTPGSYGAGAGGSTAGTVDFTAGTLPGSFPGNTVSIVAPTSVTSYHYVLPGSNATGFLLGTASGATNTISAVGSTGSGNVVLATGPTLTPANLDMSAASASNALKIPVQNAVTTTTNGAIGYDSGSNMLHAAQGSADAMIPQFTSTPANGDCAKWTVSGSKYKLDTAGAACGSGGGGSASGATLFSATSSATATATSATSLIGSVTGSTSIPGNTFTAGQLLEFYAAGYYTTPVTATNLTIDFKIGGTTRVTTGAVTTLASITNGTWRLYCGVTTRTAGSSGTQIANCTFEMTGATLTPGEAPMQTSSAWTIDTTSNQAVDLQATWNTTTGSPTITATNVAAWIPGAPVTSVNGATGAVAIPVVPGGRLTLSSTAPVMTADATAQTTIYYLPYVSQQVPVYNGSAFVLFDMTSSGVSLTLNSTNHPTSEVFDVYAFSNSGALTLCALYWGGNTARSSSAGGKGGNQDARITQVQGLWTNNAAIAASECYNGSTAYAISVNQGTLLGSFYTTSAGQTGMQFEPSAASGGTNNCLCLYNAHNRVIFHSIARDSTASWTIGSTSWRAADNNSNNRISFVDGLQQSVVTATSAVESNSPNGNTGMTGIDWDSTSATPSGRVGAANNAGSGNVLIIGEDHNILLGFHYAQAMEAGTSNTTITFYGVQNSVSWQSLSISMMM